MEPEASTIGVRRRRAVAVVTPAGEEVAAVAVDVTPAGVEAAVAAAGRTADPVAVVAVEVAATAGGGKQKIASIKT